MEPSTSAAPGTPSDPRNRKEPRKEEGEPPPENLPLLPKRVPPLGYTPPPRTESEKHPPEKQNGLDPKRPASEGGLHPQKLPFPGTVSRKVGDGFWEKPRSKISDLPEPPEIRNRTERRREGGPISPGTGRGCGPHF